MRLAGFLILLAMIFIAAHAVGSRLGPVTTGHSQVQYVGDATRGGMNTGGMNMSGMHTDGSP